MDTRHHYFNLTFGGIGKQQGVISRIIRFDRPYVTHAQIQAIRENEQIDDQAPLLGVSYLGKMTTTQWESELWQQQPSTNQEANLKTSPRWTPFQKCLTGLSVAFVLLLSVLAVMMFLSLR